MKDNLVSWQSDSNPGMTHGILNFYALWHAPCLSMNESFRELSRAYPSLSFVQVTPSLFHHQCLAEEVANLSEFYEISSVPTFIFILNGKQVDRLEGANAPLLSQMTQKYAKLATASAPEIKEPALALDLNHRLATLVSSHPLMIFIKGTPTAPRCGFSRQLIDLLTQINASYGAFDILSDEQVRQGLKTFSDWPTFPQVYLNGELVGGLDIVKELVESGEFQKMMPAQEDTPTRLARLIKRSRVMLFMKGNTSTPKCGFSRQIVSLLQELGAQFDTFDILEDEEVRQGLKEFSNWPTFPQLYIDGELVGGLDIVKEMVASGELQSLLQK